ncbi:hypothetical protein MRX96_006078 [Rhipicephalus microplus]
MQTFRPHPFPSDAARSLSGSIVERQCIPKLGLTSLGLTCLGLTSAVVVRSYFNILADRNTYDIATRARDFSARMEEGIRSFVTAIFSLSRCPPWRRPLPKAGWAPRARE